MTKKNIQNTLHRFKTTSAIKRRAYLRAFEEKMIYRTTKTENPSTTKRLVRHVLGRLR